MRIGICDDSKGDRVKTKAICLQVLKENNVEGEVIEFCNGEELLNNKQKLDVLILDIEMPDMTGIEVKNRLQYLNRNMFIIFSSSHDELMREAFGINVFGFVTKSLVDKQLSTILQSVVNITERYVIIDKDIDSRKVKYFMAERVYCTVVFNDNSTRLIRQTLGDLEKLLEKAGFIRAHRKYLVNPAFISKIDNKKIFMDNLEEPIVISNRMKSEFDEKYMKYCEENARYC